MNFLCKNFFNSKINRKHSKYVFFDLSDIRQEPYYYPIIFSFHEAGFLIKIANRPKFIGHSFGSGRFIYDLPNVVISKNYPIDKGLLITDNNNIFYRAHSWNKKVLLKPFNILDNKVFKVVLPYPMHPNSYHYGYYKKLDNLRSSNRTCRILFSGNTESEAYQNTVIHNKYGKLNRIEVIELLLKALNKKNIIVVKSKDDESLVHEKYFNGLLLYLWQWSPKLSKGLDIRIPNDQWHNFLATGDFFLCCSGIVIPQSHNAIEAMSVGTIPILQYPELFHPALIHQHNCIIFTNEEDLIEKVIAVFQLSEAIIISMRKNVIDYYDRYLHHNYNASLIEKLPDGDHEVYFYNEVVGNL